MPTKPTIRVTLATAIALVGTAGWIARAQGPAPAANPAAAPPADPAASAFPPVATPAELILDQAIDALRKMDRVAAKIHQKVDMLNQKFEIQGEYFKEVGHKVRLKLDLTGLAGADATMLQVSDGKTRWDYQKVFTRANYRKLDLVPVLDRLKNPALDPTFRDLVTANLGFGGPEALLRGFRRDARFDQTENTTRDGRKVVIVRGTWTKRDGLLGNRNQMLSPTAPLPPYIPSIIQITLGEDDHWPYEVQMIGKVPSGVALEEDLRPIGQDGRPIGVKRPAPKIDPSRLTLEYTLQSPDTITPGQFVFQAPTDPSNPVEDDTEKFLALLDQSIAAETERKNAEAAKKEAEPILKDSLIVPRPPGSGDEGLGILPKPADTPK